MRRVAALLTALALALSVACPLAADEGPVVGDHLLVTTADAPLRSRNDTTGHVPAGVDLAIKHLNGDWFWVAYEHAGQTERGWIHRGDVVERSRALDQLNERLRTNPTAAAYAVRGKLRCDHDRLDIALEDCNQALRLDRSNGLAYNTRAAVWLKKVEFDRALADWNEALRLDPYDVPALQGRASVFLAKAEVDLSTAQMLKPATAVEQAGASGLLALNFTSDDLLAIRSLFTNPQLAESLTLSHVAFCQKIVNFGVWERFEKDVFSPGQPVLLYTEVDNFSSKISGDRLWHTLLRSKIQILDKRGGLVEEMPFAPNDDECHVVRRDYYNSYEFSIPRRCTPGPYTLMLQVEDLFAKTKATQTVPFVVE